MWREYSEGLQYHTAKMQYKFFQDNCVAWQYLRYLMVISGSLDFSYRSRPSSHLQTFMSQWAKEYCICFTGHWPPLPIAILIRTGFENYPPATTISSNDDRPRKAGGMSIMSSTVWWKEKNSSLWYSECASHSNICLEIKHQPQTQLIPWLSAAKPDTSCIRPCRQFGQEGKEPQDQIRELKQTRIF